MPGLQGQGGGRRAGTSGPAATRPGGKRDDRAAARGTAGRPVATRATAGAEGCQAAAVADEHCVRHSVCGARGGRVFWDQIFFRVERGNYGRAAGGIAEGAFIRRRECQGQRVAEVRRGGWSAFGGGTEQEAAGALRGGEPLGRGDCRSGGQREFVGADGEIRRGGRGDVHVQDCIAWAV